MSAINELRMEVKKITNDDKKKSWQLTQKTSFLTLAQHTPLTLFIGNA
jgi:hypothetical protein